MHIPKLDWNKHNELNSLKETAQPDTAADVLPTVKSVAQDVPEYPATDLSADEVESVEISEDNNQTNEGGFLNG